VNQFLIKPKVKCIRFFFFCWCTY